MSSGKRWTKQEDSLLISMIHDKESVPDIADELGRSVGGVHKRVFILKIGIGRLLGVSCNSIRKTIKWLKEDSLVVKIDSKYKITDKWYQPHAKDDL